MESSVGLKIKFMIGNFQEDKRKVLSGESMHYCTLLITKELPSENKIAEIMQPYCYESIEYDENDNIITPYPIFTWDWYQIGGRYNGGLKLKINENDEYYNWGYYAREDRNKRLFYSYLLSEMKRPVKEGKTPSWMYREEDYFNSMGYRDGFLYVDGGRVDDLLNFEEQNCYICIDSNGNAIARETWDGSTFVKDEHFDEKLEEIKKNSKGMFVTVLDIHD